MEVLVLGGGLAGLSAAHQLSTEGVPVTVLEKKDAVGGMAQSISVDGYTFDLGPHRFHSQDEKLVGYVNGLVNKQLEVKIRQSRILLNGRFFDYPLKVGNAVFNMPPATTIKIVSDYLKVKALNKFSTYKDDNFEDWVVNRFGRELYEIYFKVYTEKTWGLPCSSLSADWASQRITLMSLWDTLLKTLFRHGDTPRTYVSRFHYPKAGGIGLISETLADGIRRCGGDIFLESEVKAVTLEDSRITKVAYNDETKEIPERGWVFSTIPLTELVKSINPKPPAEVVEAGERLNYRSIVFVHLMFERDRISRDHWIYLPETRYRANRVSESKNFNEGNTPKGKTVLGAEITCFKGDDTWNMDKEELTRKVLDDMVSIGLIEEKDFLESVVNHMEYAYPIYDLGYRRDLDTVLDYLKGIENLKFFGRNGLFRYNNMDHSVSMGLTAAKCLTDHSIDYMDIATQQRWFG